MNIEEILNYLEKHEIDYRLESNFCCGYIFYFLDGSVYPRRYYDAQLEGDDILIIAESVEHFLEKTVSNELTKDWRHRIEMPTISELFAEVEKHLKENYSL